MERMEVVVDERTNEWPNGVMTGVMDEGGNKGMKDEGG